MKSYSGKFIVRLPETLHKKLVQRAMEHHISLNQTCIELLQVGFGPSTSSKKNDLHVLLEPELEKLKKKFGKKWMGVVLFGSRVQGTARENSDLDVMIILDKTVPLRRNLYRWWDENMQFPPKAGEVNPHFVHFPDSAAKAGSLWLEVALHHDIVWEQGETVSSFFENLLSEIKAGKWTRLFSNGHPYWRKEDSCKTAA